MNIPTPLLGLIAFVASLGLMGVIYAVGEQPPDSLWTMAGVALGIVGGSALPSQRPAPPLD